jgi:hypothetical protein
LVAESARLAVAPAGSNSKKENLDRLSRAGIIQKVVAGSACHPCSPKWEQVYPTPDSDALGLSFTRGEAEEFWPCVEGMRAFYQRAAAEGLAALFCWG